MTGARKIREMQKRNVPASRQNFTAKKVFGGGVDIKDAPRIESAGGGKESGNRYEKFVYAGKSCGLGGGKKGTL